MKPEVKNRKRLKILAVASGGGHWVQLLRLRDAWRENDVVYATVRQSAERDVSGHQFVLLPDSNRWTKVALLRTLFSVLRLIREERPDVVITTGAAPGLFAVVVGRLRGAKTLWIDSLANAERMSLSGRLARPFADAWLTQWKHVADGDQPAFKGAVF